MIGEGDSSGDSGVVAIVVQSKLASDRDGVLSSKTCAQPPDEWDELTIWCNGLTAQDSMTFLREIVLIE